MVGAGFSRYARKAGPAIPDSPMWEDVAGKMFGKLYPQESSDDLQGDTRKTPSVEKFLRLAQEYETAFGRTELHGFARQLIRDEDHEPDEIHQRLLGLPWRDVFTTNWDTLIERASASIYERKYSIVRRKEEIPLEVPPRIFKLHGSMPSDFPLILTEEDYRTYPVKFAPFVNTVQQAMMETIFCLIGFSGDDPNFLYWSGWVRDNMGESAPKIYLAGWLGLSNHRRRMLEDRNVVPIDLSLHPKAKEWPEHLRHRYATEWILHTLEHGRRYDITDWPSASAGQSTLPPIHIQPVAVVDSDRPKEEMKSAPRSEDDDWLKQTEDMIEVWMHNRKVYPGWLIVPSSVFDSFNHGTDKWEPLILRALPEFLPVDRLNAVRELVWRREISLVPISPDVESAADSVLQLIDCQTRTIRGSVDSRVHWEDVREAWRYIALTLVTTARHNFDRTLFDQRIKALSAFLDDDPNVDQRIHHEHCLWAIHSMDFQALEKLLENWNVENVDPIWMLRKAAILVEANYTDEAKELSRRAFSQIRQITDDERSVAGASREGWALFWMAAHKIGLFWEAKEEYPTFFPFHRRWRELASRKCDAWSDKDHLSRSISRREEKTKPPAFDLNMQRTEFRFSGDEIQQRIAAQRAIRLSEVAGLPPSAFKLTMASDILKLAADELAVVEPETATRLIFRTVNYDQDDLLGRVLSRPRVAVLPQNLVANIIDLCNGIIKHGSPRLTATKVVIGSMSWTERMRVALEVMSRLVLRLDPEQAGSIFDVALGHHRDDRFAHPWLMSPLQRLLERSWEILLSDQRDCRVLDLLKAQIVGMDDFRQPSGSYDPDLGHLLRDDLHAPNRTTDNEAQWTQIVNLLVRGLRTGEEARKRAAYRFTFLASWDCLTEPESVELARALWDSRYTGDADLPRDTNLYDVVFLTLPEPQPGLAEKRFRQKWLNVNNILQEDLESLAENLWQVGNAIFWLREHERILHLSDDEKKYLIRLVGKWADIHISRHYHPSLRHFFPLGEDPLRKATRLSINGLRAILPEVVMPISIANRLYEKAQELKEAGIPAFALMASIVNSLPDRFDEVVLSMRMGLVSDKSALAEDATWGLFYWMKAANTAEPPFPRPSTELVREIGLIVATRRSGTLDVALQIAEWIFDKGNEDQRGAVSELVFQGLGYLAEELRYDRSQEGDENSIPSLRARCARLAVSAANHGFEKVPSVARWLKTIENDPMPEVRHAKTRYTP